MIEKKINSIWQGKVGLHEKYIKQALTERKGLFLIYRGNQQQYQGQVMTIDLDIIKSGEIGKEIFPEKHGSGFYRLIYYTWKADINPQMKLL